MKNENKNYILPAVLFLGLVAQILRRLLYTVAVDGKGLLISGHPLKIALWAAVLAGAVLTVLSSRKQTASSDCAESFGPSAAAAVGCAVMGGSVLMLVLQAEYPLGGMIGLLWKILGFLTAPALVWGGICRKEGKMPFFGIYGALCVFLLLYVISRYQSWSGNPQLQDYVFELLALVMLILFSYQQTAFGAEMGNRRMRLAFGLLAALLCWPAMVGAEASWLYAGGLIWAAGELYPTKPDRKDEVVSGEAA